MADATIVNTPATQDSNAAGWAVAVIVLLAVDAGGFVWLGYYGTGPTSTPDNNINVTVPVPGTGGTDTGSGNTGGSGSTKY